MIKLIALYLPQFHEIPENNRAWGEGFTEWTNVKKAVPLFEGHNQPREPLGDNYYNLLDARVMEWQVSLAKKYGIYGFCFYHYWFSGGKKVLEKPAEILLSHKELDMPFCFSWANEPWTKTWHGAAGEKEVLIEQHYGREDQWGQHFQYLLSFFKDNRYIKIDGKPVLLIYQINKIGCFNRMADYWNNMAVHEGFAGIYIIDMLTYDGKRNINKRVPASVDFEPDKGQRNVPGDNKNGCNKISYDNIYSVMLDGPHKKGEFRSVFVDYDDTPRRGAKGCVFTGGSPGKFGKYLQKTIRLSEKEQNEYIFINAWNEWGEGNYLEPDKKNGYAYLEAVQNALGGGYGEVVLQGNAQGTLDEDPGAKKYRQYYELCNQWIKNINGGCHIDEYFIGKNYRNIAVYGMGELGNRLVEELENTAVRVCYGIDKNVWAAFAEITIKGFDEEVSFGGVDCIVVTPVHLYEKLKKELSHKAVCDIISLEDAVYGM